MNPLSISWSRNSSSADKMLAALCIFSVVNPLVAQAAYAIFPYPVAGLNIMQWFQGLCFLAMLATWTRLPRGCAELVRPFSRLLWAYVVAFGLLHLRLMATGRVPADMVLAERMVYFKMIFALLLWHYASRLIQSCESARMLLRSLLFGAVISAVWVLVCYFSGLGGHNYETAEVRATAGSAGVSGKAIAGFLLPAVAGAIFLAVREGSSRWAAGAALLVVAVFVTFDRSAQVAFVAASSWTVFWWLWFAGPPRGSKTVLVFLGILLVLGGLYYARHGNEELIARWTQDFDRGEIGSGRGTFYATTWNWFWNESSTMEFLLGMGYGNIHRLMHSASGIYVHTHSDLFDMILIGGVAGLVLYLFLFYTVAGLQRGLAPGSAESATVGAILISFGVMSLLTGLMAFPHTMYAFGAQCMCIRTFATGAVKA
ncbi:MAG TPA: O-antigen ligase family protein [Sedimentisphaerales bacterium]|nr:O-antigen ligase family protein [Sedimentisphaerales bacterium]HRS12419.1 O-antigen ligase family protein [Sedimentisphaerales bacterium]HRV48939.1 O-antigen ligase family protein [Sedimentisphaerales bacterium]